MTNGTFDTDISGWSAGTVSTISFENNTMRVERTNNSFFSPQAGQQITGISDGATVIITFEVTNVRNRNPGIGWADGMGASSGSTLYIRLNNTVGSYTLVSTFSSAMPWLVFYGGGSADFNIDNVSVRELAGNPATQATTAARPLTAVHPDGGVRNLLDHTEEFDNSYWTKGNATITANSAVAPDGTTTADKLQSNGTVAAHRVSPAGFSLGVGVQTVTVYAKAAETEVMLGFLKPSPTAFATVGFTLSGDGAVAWAANSLAGRISAPVASIENVGDGWYRCSLSINSLDVGGNPIIDLSNGTTNTFAGTVGDGCLIWGAQLEVGSTATPYQKRVNFLNVTEAGKRSIRRLYFNGTSHFMQTPTITPNTDKVQVFAGVRKLSDAEIGIAVSLDGGTVGQSGAELFVPRTSATPDYAFRSRGPTDNADAIAAGFVAPVSSVLSGIGQTTTDTSILRVNGVQRASSTFPQGSANYRSLPMFIGARGGTTFFFNGFLDQLITRFGATPDETTIGKVEKYISTKVPEVTL